MVRRHDERQRLCQMRRIVEQGGTLMQGLAHQRNIALGEITYPPMNQLG